MPTESPSSNSSTSSSAAGLLRFLNILETWLVAQCSETFSVNVQVDATNDKKIIYRVSLGVDASNSV